ncbi:hypothetical protein NDU88_006045 [Pleurodeles waltl]|uniref:Secreted protein n=1 Tax=Pleurodeles waltl TaxID=8319 RepID=A0AAV7UKF5_PLEWA|nr:hypothetical protein NDU88_006045 [Pleurodeles waltl]
MPKRRRWEFPCGNLCSVLPAALWADQEAVSSAVHTDAVETKHSRAETLRSFLCSCASRAGDLEARWAAMLSGVHGLKCHPRFSGKVVYRVA